MPFPIIPALGAATSLIGMGIAKGKDKRQLTQQEKLQNLQIRGQKEMMDYGMQQQYDMWQKTNYKPQLEEMKEAGINPALMYGMGGGGGTTTGSASGNVTGADAPKGSGREVEEMGAMGLQLASQMALQKAQKENIEADTENKKADAANKPITGENIATDTAGKKLDNTFKDKSMTDRLSAVSSEAVQEIQKAQQMVNDTNVSDTTIKDRIKQIQQNAIGKVLDNTLARIEQTVKNVNIEKARAEIKAIAEYIEQGWQRTHQSQSQVEQGWKKISIDQNKNEIMERLGNAGLDLQDRNAILQTLTGILGTGMGQMPRETHNSWWSEDNQGNWQQGHNTQRR